MGKPRIPDIDYQAPTKGEAFFECQGACGRKWPLRFKAKHHWARCFNCFRAYKRQHSSKEQSRRSHLKSKYGVTMEWVAEQLGSQDSKCPICTHSITLPSGTAGVKTREAVVDHDHSTGKARGVICSGCNKALGSMGDDVASLRRAVEYLSKHKPEIVDVDAFLKTRTGVPDPVKRAPRTREEKHDPNESIDSLVSRMTASAVLEENADEDFIDTDAS